MLLRGVTRGVGIEAPPAAVLAVVTDPTNLPRFAPGFARGVVREGEGWIIDSARGRLRLRTAVDADRGTVDLHLTAPDGSESTVFLRVLPNGSGAELTFTLLLPGSASDAAVAEQGGIVAEELELLRQLCEAG
jgi:Polyketide cyclase / dehydrase and lipid transport